MFDRIMNDAIDAAGIDPDAFDAAWRKLKFKSRLDWFLNAAPPTLVLAYNERMAAERATRN